MNVSRFLSFVIASVALLGSAGARAAVDPVQAVSLADPLASPCLSAAGDSLGSMMAPNGSFVVFSSNARNLVPGDRSGFVMDVFLRTRTNGLTTLVSVNASGTGGGNRNSVASGFTPEGRYVAFVSAAGDLVADDTNDVSDVFVRDLAEAKTVLVSVNTSGQCANGASSEAMMTPDGRFVAFVSAAGDLVPEDTNGIPDVFVRDLQTGTTTLVSAGAQGGYIGGVGSGSPVISTNGQVVAFVSKATNLLAGVTNIDGEVCVRDASAGTLRWASSNVLAGFQQAFGATGLTKPASYAPVLSDDGRWLAFKTRAGYTGGSIPSTSAHCLIFRLNLQTDLLELVATNTEPGTIGFPDASGPAMTPDGSRIAYVSSHSANVPRNVFCWDAVTGTTLPVSVNLSGIISTNGMSDAPALSSDGRFVTFVSDATDLVTNTVNGGVQVYVRDLLSGTTRLVSADADGMASGDADGAMPTLSDDGRFVAFDSVSGVYVAGDGNRASDAFVRDTASDTTELVSFVAAGLASSTGDGLSGQTGYGVSADGRYVVFSSLGDNLVAGHANNYLDVYARDLVAGTNILVSVGADGSSANGSSFSPTISANGRYVAFVSGATNLVAGILSRQENVYLRDLVTGTTSLVSVNRSGTGGGDGSSSACSLSADGRRVAFQSRANNLVLGDADSQNDVLLRDLDAGTTTLVTGSIPALANSAFSAPLLSPDARFVAFTTPSLSHKLLVKDLQTGTVTDFGSTNALSPTLFSADSRWLVFAHSLGGRMALLFRDLVQRTNRQVAFGPTVPPFGSLRSLLAVSRDARYVAFSCPVALLPGDANSKSDVFLYDSLADNLTLISANVDGTGAGNDASESPSISADGRFIAYHSWASDLVDGDVNGEKDVFLYDRRTGQTTLISAGPAGLGWPTERSSHPVLNADGNLVVFRSLASEFVTGDFNATQDLFACPFTPEEVVVDPHPEFACEVLLIGDGLTELSWNAAPGRAYQVQFTDYLAVSAWKPVATTTGIVGPRARILDGTASGATQRFYRVVLVE